MKNINMTHNQKLDKILMALLSRLSKRLEDCNDDKRLSLKFICNALFQDEQEDWETKFLENRLIEDGYISFVEYEGIQLPNITSQGVSFIQKGGYQREEKLMKLEEELKIQTLKNAKRWWVSLAVAITALIFTILSFLLK